MKIHQGIEKLYLTKSPNDGTRSQSYNVSQPPLSTVVSNFLAMRVGIPCPSQIFRISSNRAACKYCLLPRLIGEIGWLVCVGRVGRTLGLPHRHVHLPMVIEVRRRRKSALVDVQIQQRASLDQKINPNRTAAPAILESARGID